MSSTDVGTSVDGASLGRVYVSITGLELKSFWYAPRFWWFAVPAAKKAQSSPGILRSMTASIQGVQHTVTVWKTRSDMVGFLQTEEHIRALKETRNIGRYSKVYGYECDYEDSPCDWHTARGLWAQHGRVVLGDARPGDVTGRRSNKTKQGG